MPQKTDIIAPRTSQEVIRTGGEVHKRSHLIARILVGVSLLILTPAVIVTFGRFIEYPRFAILLAGTLGFAIAYYFLIPTKYIPRFGYLAADVVFYLLFFATFWYIRGFPGFLLLFFYLLLFGIINALSYNWRDIVITIVEIAAVMSAYNFLSFMPAVGYSIGETIGVTILAITVLAILTAESRVLADEALVVQRKAVELQTELTRVQELDRLKTEFIGVVSHQMRTPLSGIKWALASLSETGANLTQSQTGVIALAAENINRMIAIVSSMLDIAKVEEQAVLLKPSSFTLQPLVNAVIDELRLLAEQKKITVEAAVPDGIMVVGIQQSLKQAIANVIDNAIRYSQKPGARVTVAAEEKNGKILLSVADNGIGMNEEAAAKAFTKFFRAPEAIKASPDGSGLGLYYTKRIIEQHGGSIDIESTPGEGTTVTITLPSTAAKKS